ncbi:SDR family oxidoreductase [Actinoallomurus purpureus]|uniref:SDR family NAD(P)-dependent oxidoreductase n=1 Tax=Actinoallomurus purpureus TaxID=478114 RepID=UPI0020933350|nr:SDR family oxidoreductase [Actinoallomurus purpureus]MCO6003489.1 SDR family oxidoreductase [Actinoallomurus purpureus]
MAAPLKAIVTGGASGIGAATVAELTEHGVRVAVLDVNAPPGGGTPFALADLTDDAAVRRATATLISELDGLDILVNNAGIGATGTIETNPDDEWHRVFDVNVVGLVRVTRAALPALRRSPSAAIVNTSSVVATTGLPNRALYSATKGAVLSLTLAMSADLLAEDIRVNAVLPGTTDTPWVGRLLDAADDPGAERAALNARQPHGRLVRPEEVAATIAFLALPGAASLTGSAITIDGGLTTLRPPPAK